MIPGIRLVLAAPLLVASQALFNLGATVAGSTLRTTTRRSS
jgi:hypothetical protein